MAKKFLPNVSVKRLRDLEKNEKDPKAKTILLACIARKEGKRIAEIARMLNRHHNTVRGWLTRVSEGGLKRRYDIKNRGADCKLSGVQTRQLLKTLDAGPGSAGYETNLWTMKLVHAYIKSEFGVEYHPDSIWQLLHRLEFRPVRPRPVNPRSATPEEIEAFKKKAQRMATHWGRKGHRILVMDEAHVHLKIVPRTTWTRAKNPTIPTSGMWDRGRVTIMGVIGDDGLNYFDFCDTGNWDNTRMFLLKVYAEFGRTLIFMDNASCHIAGELEKITRQTGGGMQFRFLPKYTPELSPIETQWIPCKNWIYSTPLKDARHLAMGLKGAISRGIVGIVKMHADYVPNR